MFSYTYLINQLKDASLDDINTVIKVHELNKITSEMIADYYSTAHDELKQKKKF
jgi:hypothetical protein